MVQAIRRLACPLFAARVLALAALFFVPISTALTNATTLLFVVALLCAPEFWRRWRLLYRHPVGLAALLLALAFLCSIGWGVTPMGAAFSWTLKYRKLLWIPLLIAAFAGSNWTEAARRTFFAAQLLVLVLATSNFLRWTTIGPLYTAGFPDSHAWVFKNHITAGIFGALFFSMALEYALGARRTVLRVLFFILAAWILVYLFVMMQGRTGQIIAIIFCLLYGIYYVFRGQHGVGAIAARVLLFALPCALLVGGSLFLKTDRLLQITHEYQEYSVDNQETSVGLRIEWYRKSLQLFAHRPVLGYGVGGLQTEFDQLTEGLSGARGAPTRNPHNQFLLCAVELGTVGVLLFLNLLVQAFRQVRPLRTSGQRLLAAYLLAFTIGCIANSLLLDFSEGNLFVLLTGILLGCAWPWTAAPPGDAAETETWTPAKSNASR
ncbi:MAG: O-antigen ligase family protein [Janthinobacterium lividum]